MKTLPQIKGMLQQLSTPETKLSVQKFVTGSQRVYGVKMPFINALAKELKGEEFVLVNKLWKSGSFEEKMLAAKLIGNLSKKNPIEAIDAVDRFSNNIGDWAICDTLGMQS